VNDSETKAVAYIQGSSVCSEHAYALIHLADLQQRLDRIVKITAAKRRRNGKAAVV
jgi:hypothetical protein